VLATLLKAKYRPRFGQVPKYQRVLDAGEQQGQKVPTSSKFAGNAGYVATRIPHFIMQGCEAV